MSLSFSGFSEDDIKNLNDKKRTINDVHNKQKNKPIKTEKVFKNCSTIKETHEISTKALFIQPEVVNKTEVPINTNIDTKLITENSSDAKVLTKSLPDDNLILKLVDFECKQKLIKEQNRIRKELLLKALEQKDKQSKNEQRKLQEIHKELNSLDCILSNDVKVLRKNIDDVSFEYMNSQKRFDKMEKEYIQAKLHMEKLKDKKELLTEHLCTIISKNEERKAEKLTELLEKLELSETDLVISDNNVENVINNLEKTLNNSE